MDTMKLKKKTSVSLYPGAFIPPGRVHPGHELSAENEHERRD